MNTGFLIPEDRYRDISFDLIHQIISNCFFLNSDFSVCYRFISFPNALMENKRGRLEVIKASASGIATFDDYYSAEYDLKAELFIHFLDSRYKVESLKAYFGNPMAMILRLIDPAGRSLIFYGAGTDPFNPKHKKIYGVEEINQ